MKINAPQQQIYIKNNALRIHVLMLIHGLVIYPLPHPLGQILHTDFPILYYISLKMTHISTLTCQCYPVTAMLHNYPYVKRA